MKSLLFEGCCTATVTPFINGKIDLKSFKKLLTQQVNSGVAAVCVLGTTGESCTISERERTALIKTAVRICSPRIKVIVGTGSNNQAVAIKQSIKAKQLGADGLLVVAPYYNMPNENGVCDYYKQISNIVKLPIIVYNVPKRTGLNITPKLMKKLCEIKYVVGLKEASSDITQIIQNSLVCKDNIALYCGNDNLNYTFLSLGAKGIISVGSNAFPCAYSQMCTHALSGEIQKCKTIHDKLQNFNNILSIDTNPIPIKCVLSLQNKMQNELRKPLHSLQKNKTKKVAKMVKSYSNFDKMVDNE